MRTIDRCRAALFCGLVLLAASAWPQSPDPSAALRDLLAGAPEFLPVDEAFRFDGAQEGDAVVARWTMPPGYYLYRHGFEARTRAASVSAAGSASAPVLGALEIPAGLPKHDDYFGDVEVYYDAAMVRVPIAAGSGPHEIGITYQGCADAGLCYPPETRWVPVALEAPAGAAAAPSTTLDPAPATEDQQLAALLADGGLLMALLVFFVGGIGLAFTPCVLPMVPILSSIIVGQQGALTRSRSFGLSLAYVCGMALTYAVVGTLVGLFGAGLNLQAALQSPPVLVTFAALFVLLALSMFGFYELQLPARWQSGISALGDRFGGGRHTGVLVMGALSALVVSPCVSAPLAGALIYLSTTGDAVLGGAALLALGLGMGVPLLVIGASGGHLLPRTGAWMNTVKTVFGVGLLGVAIWLLERVIPAGATLVLWAALAIGVGVYLGALDFAPRTGWGQLWKASGAFSFVCGVLLLIGAASGAADPLRPLERFGIAAASEAAAPESGRPLEWRPVANLTDLEAELAAARAAGTPAVLDLYADWCISCKVMERSVFPRPEVAALLGGFRLLRADVTDNTPQQRALLDAYGLFGPPSLVFFGRDGREIDGVRIQGEIGATSLAAHLDRVLTRAATGLAATVSGTPDARDTGEIAANN